MRILPLCPKFIFKATSFFIICMTQLFAGQKLPGFIGSPYFNEQIVTFQYEPEVRMHINAPAEDDFDPEKPTGIMLFALPNGNTIEWTAGKQLQAGDDWHYDIQHIAAQTRFLRQATDDYNLVTVYLETVQKSWPSWKAKYVNHASLVKGMVEYIRNIFKDYSPFVILSGHSGGGRFTFSYLDGVTDIPDYVDRISFLDSNYGYEDVYGPKFVNWLNASPGHFLSVIAYNDSVALYNGQPVVSATGGTWYRSRMMKKYLDDFFTFTVEEDTEFIRYTALNGRIKFILKQNPQLEILHTIQVERNGCIQGMFSGTGYEGVGYVYYGERAYTALIQPNDILPPMLLIPPRASGAPNGSQFMQQIMNMSFEQRETEIYNQISAGNIPDFLRIPVTVQAQFEDVQGAAHQIEYYTMPDYLAVGADSDFCRIPMGPITAQKLADLFGATMPTSKLVDNIYLNCAVKLEPVTYTPVGNANELVPKFIEHNTAIESQRSVAGAQNGQLTGGIKKDVVISNKIIDPARPNHVVIYGWHQLNGQPIQPLTNIHINSYVDYSHGVRFLNNFFLLDGKASNIRDVLKDSNLYKVLSNETGLMSQPTYLVSVTVPGRPKSFGVKTEATDKLRLVIKADENVAEYLVYLSRDGLQFDPPFTCSPDNLVLENLAQDSVYFIKIKAVNAYGESPESEVLAGIPSVDSSPSVLVIHGFDRASTGNTYNFIRQHAHALVRNGARFASATNEAIADGIFTLTDYAIADLILGDESTADETFSATEQNRVKEFLQSGGRLFVSGSEIAWDLDYKGSAADKDFIWSYLKMKYKDDTPGGTAGVCYQASATDNSIFGGLPVLNYDNGTQGTINVKWPDVVAGFHGGKGFVKYANLDTTSGFGGVLYEGLFPGGSSPGKIVCLGFPFESIYPDSSRTLFMHRVLTFFDYASGMRQQDDGHITRDFELFQNFPNPFNPVTTISFFQPVTGPARLKVYNSIGQLVSILADKEYPAGMHRVIFDGGSLSSGAYFYLLEADHFSASRKMLLLK